MNNFTPFKKTKKPVNKLFLIGNIALLTMIILLGVFYVGETKFPYKGKATECTPNKLYCRRDISGLCPNVSSNLAGFLCDNTGQYNDSTCTAMDGCAPYVNPGSYCDVGSISRGDFIGCSSENHQWNCNCKNNVTECSDNTGGTSCGFNTPGGNPPEDTPTPTPTGELSPTPTATPPATPTPTEVITNTPTPTTTLTPTATPTGTPGPTATNTPGPSATPIPVLCGTKDCDNATNPCRSGYSCVQAKDGSNYCTSPDFADACKANPSYNSCCTAPGAPTATPTEIVLAKTSPTKVPVPVSGEPAWLMFIIPVLIIIGSLIL